MAVVAIVALSTAANADWRWTRWGTPEWAIRNDPNAADFGPPAGSRPVVDIDGRQVRTRLSRVYFVGETIYSANLMFDEQSGGLACVELLMLAASVDRVTAELRETYGVPDDDKQEGASRLIRWVRGNDVITLHMAQNSTKVRYCENRQRRLGL